MADNNATRRHPFPLTTANNNAVPANGRNVAICSTVEIAAAATAGTTYAFHRIPSNARIMPDSYAYWDDLASTGSPTFDFGLGGGQVTDDPDALSNGHDVTAAGSGALHSAIADYGKFAWELAGESSDPGGMLDVYGSLVDAAANTGGTVSVYLHYTVD